MSTDMPELARILSAKQPYLIDGPGGVAKGYLLNGEFMVAAEKKPDGSLIQETHEARRTIDTILFREGHDAPFRADALRRLDEAPANVRVSISPTLEAVKWQGSELKLALDGPLMDPAVAVKTAYEFLACHLGADIYGDHSTLVECRRMLRDGTLDPSWISVDRLHADKAQAFHGLVFEGNSPHATVQIRLFGKLAFRVHFLRLALGGPRFQYTHYLTDNSEQVRILPATS
jgi:hypothetical protein